jgi:DNA-binding NtrC family response regulator
LLHIPSLIPPAILIVDDEPFIALDLALAVEDAGCLVVGPAGSVREAIGLLETSRVTAAILDVNLSDGDVTPVVDILVARGLPLIFQTGVGLPPSLKARYPDLLVYAKPVMSERLVEMLIGLIPQV